MTERDTRFLTAAIGAVALHGVRRTTMSDIAEAAQVSRQTLYARFAGKDDVIVAAILHLTAEIVARIRDGWAGQDDLAACLDIYFDLAVVEVFDMIRAQPGAQDLFDGPNARTAQAIRQADAMKRAALTDLFARHGHGIVARGQTVAGFATFVQTAASGFKTQATSREELASLVSGLNASVLAVAAT